MSITKFVDTVKKDICKRHKMNVQKALLFFEPNATFTNEYSNICIEPIGIVFETDDKNKYKGFYHLSLIEEFDHHQPVITFTKSNKRKIKQNCKTLQFLSIDFNMDTFTTDNGTTFEYYPSFTGISYKKYVANIKKNKINRSKKYNDISDDEVDFL